MTRYAIVDIETTGGNYNREKITEIAIVVHDGTTVIDKYVTLINPERSIPSFISRLTGINDDMVATAPRFYEVARRIVELTENCVFVAHNVNFDYNFIKREFYDLGFRFQRKRMCTCKLSRRAFKGLPSYGLGKICEALKIENTDRHRAMGDAAATAILFEMIYAKIGSDEINRFLNSGEELVYLPPQVEPKIYHSLPEETGVYYFKDATDKIIYVGKSANIKKRVGQHFREKNPMKQKKLLTEISSIDFEITGSEIVALLIENRHIKEIRPRYNRAKKKTDFDFGIYDGISSENYLTLKVAKQLSGIKPIASYTKKSEAEAVLLKVIKDFQLCTKICGITQASRGCFEFQIGLCYGACICKEDVDKYNSRVESAIRSLMLKKDNMLIIDRGRDHDERSVIQIEDGSFRGYGYISKQVSFDNVDAIKDSVSDFQSDPDAHRIIKSALRTKNYETLINY